MIISLKTKNKNFSVCTDSTLASDQYCAHACSQSDLKSRAGTKDRSRDESEGEKR